MFKPWAASSSCFKANSNTILGEWKCLQNDSAFVIFMVNQIFDSRQLQHLLINVLSKKIESHVCIDWLFII